MNWYEYLIMAAMVAVFLAYVGHYAYKLMGVEQIKRWLLWAVMEAETQLGTGTGEAKLLLVYNWFVKQFPIVSKFIKFDVFSFWVDTALDGLCEMLKKESISTLVYGVKK